MISEIIKESILSFFKKNSHTFYTANQVRSAIGVTKDNMDIIQSILNELSAQLIIEKQAKKYKMNIEYLNRENKTKPETTPETIILSEKNKSIENNIVTGTFDASPLAKNLSFAFVIMENEDDIMVSSEDTLNAYHGDTVEVEVMRRGGNKRSGIIRKVIHRKKTKFVGTVANVHQKGIFTCDSFKIHTTFNVSNYQQDYFGKKVIIEIDHWGNKLMNQLPQGHVTEVLGESGVPEVELLAVIKDFDLPLEFPENVIKEALKIDEKISQGEIEQRSDYRNLFTITIDPISAKDFDDAISLEDLEDGKIRLYVHIADVAHYLRFDSALFTEALERGNSYYFPKKVLPMLPEILSNKICSLRPDEEKLTLTVITDFDASGLIIHQEVQESVINSNARLTYEEVDLLFEGKEHPLNEDVVKMLNSMKKLSKVLSRKRHQLGYLRFDLPEVEYVFDDDGYLIDLKRSRETDSHILIENFMLIANEYVAEKLTKIAPATLYRIHEEPDEADLMKVKDILKFHKIDFKIERDINKTWQNVLESLPTEEYHRVFDRIILRSMKKAKYSTAHIAHFGLGIDTYTHFTSPIRRLCDLIVHAQLKKHLFHKNVGEVHGKDLSPASIFNYAGIATQKEVVADESERAMEQKIMLSFMKKKVGETYKGIIISLTNSALIIELDILPVRGVVKYASLTDDYYELYDRIKVLKGRRKGKIYKLADQVEVQISMVSDDIYFNILSLISKKIPEDKKYKHKKPQSDRKFKNRRKRK